MLDFLLISTRCPKKGVTEIYPKFIMKKSSDLMIRGGDFYAIWNDEKKLWSTDEEDAIRLIDNELRKYYEEHKHEINDAIHVSYMWDAESGMIDKWHKYCQKQLRDSFQPLDEQLIFSNTETTKKDYASRKLDYPLEAGDFSAYDELMSTLYTPEERMKIEWAIGAVISGDSKYIQKFIVMYGAPGTGKSTVLNIIQDLFAGYHSVFDAKALGSVSNVFALEAFRTNPLVAIQHDGDLSKIEDNTRLNSVVSHEVMMVNEKFKATYASRFNSFLFMGTNKPVKITDAKSGILRRLIDVSPSGNKVPAHKYKTLVNQIKFELGAIAQHCLDVYQENKGYYDDYIPMSMMGASNDFYNFVMDSYDVFKRENGTSLKAAWEMYITYCDMAKVSFPFSQRIFKEELKNYFDDFEERKVFNDGNRIRNWYSGFKTSKFEYDIPKEPVKEEVVEQKYVIDFNSTDSLFDKVCDECPAQYATKNQTPFKPWEEVTTCVSDIDTSKLHYVKVPENHIVIDFDLKDEDGNKSFEKNLEAASLWIPTYAELSKSGAGIHLHYIYKGDVTKLSRVYGKDIEIKVFNGGSSLRRLLTKCNDLPIATITSGLPLKGEDNKVVNFEAVKSERSLRNLIERNIRKEIHPGTKPSIDFIYKILEDAYKSGLKYDVSDMKNQLMSFATASTNHSLYCLKMVSNMRLKSDEPSVNSENYESDKLVFYDVEVFPNLFLVNWKMEGKEKPVARMINPSSADIESILKFKLVGFNCRRYDNHILYARLMGYSNEELFRLSQKIIEGKEGFFHEAWNISYTDVYDFASAANKKSLKKWEIELGIHHQELGLPWDQPVPEERWVEVAEYCDNDVLATEAVFNHLSGDWTARQILAELAGEGSCVNDTTNVLTTRIIFGNNRKPQDQFNYRNLAEPVSDLSEEVYQFLADACPTMMSKTHGDAGSLLPYFPGYEFKYGKSTYRGEEVGEGGYVHAETGIHVDVALLDIASMHPHSTIAECLFGPKYTKAYYDVVYGRVNIKHEAWDLVNEMLDGKLTPFIQRVINGEMTSKELADALKTAINSVYGLTSAKFENPFHDPRNIDNIVAKRGALFMINLKYEVRARGFTSAHIKTDSIKIPNATPEIIQFVMDYGKDYGYTFEHEATYDKMCLVNDAVYIARYASAEKCQKLYGYIPGDNNKKGGKWTATGAQFQVPYVFKTLFSKEPIEFSDMCETKSCTTALYLDMNEGLPDVENYEKEHEKLYKLISDPKHIHEDMTAECTRLEELTNLIDEGHNYRFVGKVGSFCPMKPGAKGGLLMREKDGKYYAAAGTKGYRWVESETVKVLSKEKDIDTSYYNALVDEAVEAISKYGDFEWFASDEEYIAG